MHANHDGWDVLVDALIAGGSSAFGVFAGLTAAGILTDPKAAVVAAVVAFGVSFFAGLQAARSRPLPKE